MTILVTGGAGYIGSHTAKALSEAGMEPVAFDDLSTGHRDSVRWGPLVEGSLADREQIAAALRRHSVDAVIHFAAKAYVGESVVVPRMYFQSNVVNTLNLLAAMLDCGVKHIVFSSTCAVYGIPEHVPITEQQAPQPVNPYGESKAFVERVLSWYGQAYGLRWVALRYFNASGADPEGRIGEVHQPETHLIPLAIRAALGLESAIGIFGVDYPTPDGTAVRDYIHVEDLARAHLLALDHLRDGGDVMALNLGTGHGSSVREVLNSVESVSGRQVPAIEMDRRAGDPPILVADPSLAGQELGWQASYKDLDGIVKTAWKWHSRGDAYADSVPSRR
ncbi:MAG TPA: UDP-glucose 4-epimerase GalE [Chloroflexota bacterium]|nr:UDP-glucose 4-epimerase GalE [Chloroflexota bacterium]